MESKEAFNKSLNGPPSTSASHPPAIHSSNVRLRTLSNAGNSTFNLEAFILRFLCPLAFFPLLGSFQPGPSLSLGSSAFLVQPRPFLAKQVLTPSCRCKLGLAPQKEPCPMVHSWRPLRTSGCTISCSVSLSSPRVPNLRLGR